MQIYSRLTACLSSVLWSLLQPFCVTCTCMHTYTHSQFQQEYQTFYHKSFRVSDYLSKDGARLRDLLEACEGIKVGSDYVNLQVTYRYLLTMYLFLSWKKFHSPMGKWMQLCTWRQRWVGMVTEMVRSVVLSLVMWLSPRWLLQSPVIFRSCVGLCGIVL